MTSEETALVRYRLERAREAIDEARLLFETGHLHTYVNRLYYACFYAVSALLLTQGLSTGKHTQVRSLLHKDFIRTGKIPVEHGQFFNLLFNNRQKGDYSDLVVFQADQVEPWLEQTIRFMDCVAGLIPE
jgi:uncharacterized protein (UPF0332 family)